MAISRAEEFMQLAIDLAWRGAYSTAPNPRVGCVLVKNDEVIGRGFHQKAGAAHAEVNAIADASKAFDISGATAYVTLEPCNHTGKTAPCTDALIAAKVDKVIVAMTDPNPLVSGQGIARLQEAGIIVDVGLLEQQARALNPGFIKRMETGLPWVRVKLAMSLDGRTAMASGESQWITGAEARSDVQELRARSSAIISGIDTVLVDDASLTVRADELSIEKALRPLAAEQQPLRVVLDSTLKLPVTAKILSQPGTTLVVAARENLAAKKELEQAGAEVIYCGEDCSDDDGNENSRVDLAKLLKVLAERQINEVLVEAGATVAGAFTEKQLVDQYTVYMAPTLLGSNAKPLMTLPLDMMAEQRRLRIESIKTIGDDWRIDAQPVIE